MMAAPLPSVTVEIAFTTNPDDPAPAWVDLDAAGFVVKSVQVKFGRAYEQDQVQPGTATVTVDNSRGDFTPGNSGGRYFPNVVTDRRLRITVAPPAGALGGPVVVFDGTVERWPVDIGHGYEAGGDTVITAIDGSDFLACQLLFSAYAQEVLADAPIAYYPLTEAVGASTVGQLSTAVLPSGQVASPGTFLYAGVAGGAGQLAGVPLVPADSGGSLLLSPHTNAAYTPPLPDGGPGIALDGVGGGTPWLRPDAGLTVELWASLSNGYIAEILRQADVTGTPQVTVRLGSDDDLIIQGSAAGGANANAYTINSDPRAGDGNPHHFAFVLEADGETTRTYIDGELAHISVATTPVTSFPLPPARLRLFGCDPASLTYGYPNGRVGHVALYNRPLNAAAVLRHYQAAQGFPGDLPGARAARILNYAGWQGARVLDAGETPLGPLQSTGQTPLALLQDVAQTEQGVFYLPGGTATLQGRARRRNTRRSVTLTAGDRWLPVEPDLTFELDRTHLVNDIIGSRPAPSAAVGGGSSQGTVLRVRDPVSIARHRRRTASTTYQVLDDESLRQVASWDLFLHKEPTPRAPHATVDPLTAPDLWQWALGLRLSDRITIAGLPPTAPAPSLDFLIESYELVLAAAAVPTARCTWLLSPVTFSTLRADAEPSLFTRLDAGLTITY